MICCLCNKEIKPNSRGWDGGNNAQPIKDGKCCDNCNNNKVIPERLRRFAKTK